MSTEEKTIDEMQSIKDQLKSDMEDVKGQINLLQARLSALEAQVAHLEPMVEARASRTEKLVTLLQLELQRFHKSFEVHEAKENTHQEKIEAMLVRITSYLLGGGN